MHLWSVLLLAQAAEEIRHLEPTEIQGKVPVPQVLFVSARNAPRFEDGLLDRLAPQEPDSVPMVPIDRATWAALTAPGPPAP